MSGASRRRYPLQQLLQLPGTTGADHSGGDPRPVPRPGQRDNPGGQAQPVGGGGQRIDNRVGPSTQPGVDLRAHTVGQGAAVPAGEHALRQGSGSDDTDPQVVGRGNELLLDLAGQQGIFVLDGHDPRGGRPGGGHRELPARVVAYPGIAGPAGADGPVEGLRDLIGRGLLVPVTDGPEVQMVGAEGLQGRVELVHQRAARTIHPPAHW